MGAVEEDADGGTPRLETLRDEIVNGNADGKVWVVDPFPREGSRGLVAVVCAKVGVAEKQEQILEVLNAPLHQVGKDRIHLDGGNCAGSDQVFIPLLVAGTGNERDALAAAMAHQRIECVRHGPLAAQQP